MSKSWGHFHFWVNYPFNVLFVSSTFAVSIIMYIYFLSLHLSHSQTQAAGRQALKDAWFIWPINCHCQGREGEGEREKKSYPQCSFAHLERKNSRKKEWKVKGTVPRPHLTLPIICQSYCEHHTGWPCLAHVFLFFFLLFPRSGSLLLHWDTSCYAMKPVWQLLPLKSFNILKLPPVPQATAVWQQSLMEN